MTNGKALKERRKALGLPGHLLCARAKIDRARLCAIEREYVTPRADELARLDGALKDLEAAKSRIEAMAAEVGWPL